MDIIKIAPILLATDFGIGKLIDVLFFVARAIIIAIGGGVGLIKIVKGKSDENPKDFGEGLAAIGIAGVLFAATFAITAAF